jgi:Protein of unknown function (DUF1499)
MPKAPRRMTGHGLASLRELAPAPRRRGFRIAPPGWPGPADAPSPVFPIAAAELWRAWIALAAGQPRTVLWAQDERSWRSLHIQRSCVFRFPDLVRAEIMALGPERSSLVLESRSRFGCWDLGVNRRRVTRWLHDLQQGLAPDRLR